MINIKLYKNANYLELQKSNNKYKKNYNIWYIGHWVDKYVSLNGILNQAYQSKDYRDKWRKIKKYRNKLIK